MFSPPRDLPERAPRLADGRYVLLSRLGRGGMAGVYAAWDTRIDEWRAIKVLLPKHARDGSLRARFEREGTTMMALHHPNLCRVFEVGHGDKLPFLVMELINAGSLYRWTKVHGVMPARMAVETTLQLCAGVSAVHEAGVVHRDIKPRNVLINWDGVLKLTDFGIAQLEDSGDTRTGLAMGTLGFMSPEQLHDAKSVDLRTDIYALGATLWSQLTARKARDLFRLEDKPGIMDGIAPLLRPILSQCLAYDPDDRFQTADELAETLADVLAELPEDPPDTPPLQLPLESISLKSKPENTFSEILTTLSGEEDYSVEESGEEEESPRRNETPRRSESSAKTPSRQIRTPPPQSLVAGLDQHRSLSEQLQAPKSVPPQVSEPKRISIQERLAEDDPASLPDYLQGVEQPKDKLRPELITYTPEVKPVPKPPPVKIAGQILLVLLLLPVIAMVTVVLIVVGSAGIGTVQVRSAAEEVSLARDSLSGELQNAEPLISELAEIGASPVPLKTAYERWRSSEELVARSKAAVSFVHLAEEEANLRIGFGSRSHSEEMVVQRLERLQASRERLLEAENLWTLSASSPQGWLAVAVRLAPPPDI